MRCTRSLPVVCSLILCCVTLFPNVAGRTWLKASCAKSNVTVLALDSATRQLENLDFPLMRFDFTGSCKSIMALATDSRRGRLVFMAIDYYDDHGVGGINSSGHRVFGDKGHHFRSYADLLYDEQKDRFIQVTTETVLGRTSLPSINLLNASTLRAPVPSKSLSITGFYEHYPRWATWLPGKRRIFMQYSTASRMDLPRWALIDPETGKTDIEYKALSPVNGRIFYDPKADVFLWANFTKNTGWLFVIDPTTAKTTPLSGKRPFFAPGVDGDCTSHDGCSGTLMTFDSEARVLVYRIGSFGKWWDIFMVSIDTGLSTRFHAANNPNFFSFFEDALSVF